MKINSTTTTTRPLAFGAVRFQPQNLNKWNQKVLAATIESPFVKNLIRRNENVSQVDTILRYSHSQKEICEEMTLSILSGSSADLDIHLSRFPCYKSADRNRVLSKELVDEIKKNDRIFELKKNLEEIKKISANVIYTIE